jgi:hypothetical protein
MGRLSKVNLDAVFGFICEYKRAHDGNSPSTREIAEFMEVKVGSTVTRALRELDCQGRIVLTGTDGASRSIEVIGGEWRLG